jgi:hypothetical protein
MPQRGVICFFQDMVDHLVAQGMATEIKALKSEVGQHQEKSW